MEIKLTVENFESVTNTDKPVLIDFWATWCGPCRMIAPVIEEIANEREDILVCKCNVDEEVPLAVQFGVNVIPTLVVLKNGRVTARTEGLAGKQMGGLRFPSYVCVVDQAAGPQVPLLLDAVEQVADGIGVGG